MRHVGKCGCRGPLPGSLKPPALSQAHPQRCRCWWLAGNAALSLPDGTTISRILFAQIICFPCFLLQPAYLEVYCFETQLVTRSWKWPRRRRLRNLSTSSSATHSELPRFPFYLRRPVTSPTCLGVSDVWQEERQLPVP